MLVYRIGKSEFINDISGYGASLANNRWNSKGVFMLYTSNHISLSLLEVMVHLPYDILINMKLSMLTLEIDENYITSVEKLPYDWQNNEISVRKIGDKWIASGKSVGLKVPSIVVPEESNVIFNPKHLKFKESIRIVDLQPFEADKRLFASKFSW
jgi:RES domain-containing protein